MCVCPAMSADDSDHPQGDWNMIEFTAHSDGKVLVPDEPVDLPRDRELHVTVRPVGPPSVKTEDLPAWVVKGLEISAQMPKDLPRDMAVQHDHYIHGTPKK